MKYYEEEAEMIPDCVINYYFVAGSDQLVSFSVLPLLWSEDETTGNSDTQIFLCGTAVTGQKMYEKVIAWRPEISYALPMIYVLSKDKVWMQLQKPRRSFKHSIMSTLITVHCLHFLKWNLKADVSALWTQLHKAFSTYEVAPSKSHLFCHLPLIEEAAKRDKDLAKSELLPTLLLETPTCEVNRATKKLNFEVGSQVDYEENDRDDDDVTYDSVCVLCDDGGVLIRCEDKCLRSFHPNINAGVNSSCESLGYSDAQLEAIQTFFCNNCQYQQHQCFVCGKLGSSDQSSVPEVFQCANADCGHFYHPNCVAEFLQPCDTFKTKELQLKIHSGDSFVCPAHKCNICMKGEDKTVHELQFAMCRRCPKAYHRKCLPSEITFQSDGNIDQRAWDGLLSNRILIYCMDHEILSEIGTPKRDHIIFPNVEGKMQTTSGLLSSKEKLIKSRDMGSFTMRSPLKRRLNHAGIYCGHSTSATFTKERSHAQGKEITDNDILNWANDKVESSGKKTRIESFKDKTLSNGIFFLDLLSAVEARVVNWDFVTNGENDEEKKSNATYIISVARKLGCSIFLLPEDIMEVNSKMILYLTASIMYWSLNQKGGGHKLHPSGRSSDASPAESELIQLMLRMRIIDDAASVASEEQPTGAEEALITFVKRMKV